MPGFADLPQATQDLQPAVTSAVTGTIIGTTMPISGAGRVAEVAQTALVLCYTSAPGTPDEILREAAIRVTAWLIGTRANARSERKVDPSGAGLEIQFQNQASTPNPLRNSGALSLLAPYKLRRAGVI